MIADAFLGKYKWYRKAVGGKWSLVAPWPSTPSISPLWVRGRVMSFEKVFEVEE